MSRDFVIEKNIHADLPVTFGHISPRDKSRLIVLECPYCGKEHMHDYDGFSEQVICTSHCRNGDKKQYVVVFKMSQSLSSFRY